MERTSRNKVENMHKLKKISKNWTFFITLFRYQFGSKIKRKNEFQALKNYASFENFK